VQGPPAAGRSGAPAHPRRAAAPGARRYEAARRFPSMRRREEDTASCRDFLRDLKARGLRDPLAIISDGAPGLIRAVEEVFPKSLRQRCLAHKLRNLQSKVPEERWSEVIPTARAVYQASSPAFARLARNEFVKTWRQELPSAVACFEDHFEACIAHLRLPFAHRRVT
jgi:putative transposase